jgi:predicted transcriptional regulator
MSTPLPSRVDQAGEAHVEQLASEAKCLTDESLEALAFKGSTERNDWIVQEIEDALRSADAGDFAGEEEVHALERKWQRHSKPSL